MPYKLLGGRGSQCSYYKATDLNLVFTHFLRGVRTSSLYMLSNECGKVVENSVLLSRAKKFIP